MIFRTTFFPITKKIERRRNRVLIGVGCNIGNCIRRFKKLFQFLDSHPKIKIIKTAPLYKNPPFGYLEQDDFINSVMIIETSFSAKELLYFLLHTEKKFKRKRSFKNAPRTLDLDIILYDDVRYSDRKLSLHILILRKGIQFFYHSHIYKTLILNIGNIIAVTIKPIETPTITIRVGSNRESSFSIFSSFSSK